MTAPTPYLLFPGTCRAALEDYQRVFGGELTLHTYRDFSRTDGPGDDIAHGELRGPVTLQAADAGADEDAVALTGVMLSLLGHDEPLVLRRWFDELSIDGTVASALEKRPWGDWDGVVVDAHGLRWLIGFQGD
ncbi:VOC family protein [Microbacterium sp. NPDC055683]